MFRLAVILCLLVGCSAPAPPHRVIHIADWHWVDEADYDGDDYPAFLETVERVQQQQMEAIRKLGVRRIYVEGYSDQNIDDLRAHVRQLQGIGLLDEDSPLDVLIMELRRIDLMVIGAAGRLLMAAEIDEVLPLEDYAAWRAAKPVDGKIDPQANEYREQAMVKRLANEPTAVIVLGMGHDLKRHLPRETVYQRVEVDALPAGDRLSAD